MDTILDEYSIEGRNVFIYPLKQYKCNGINCNVELVEMLK